jgi:hypothetical protein
MRLVALVVALAAIAGDLQAQQAVPPKSVEDVEVRFTNDQAAMLRTILAFACKASPGEDFTVCDAATALRKLIAEGKRVSVPAPAKAEPTPSVPAEGAKPGAP